MAKNKTLFKITQNDYNKAMEMLIECSCNSRGKYSLLECAKDIIETTDDFYEEVTFRLLVRLHNYGEIDLNKHFTWADDKEALNDLKKALN